MKAVFDGGESLAFPLWDKGPIKVLSYIKFGHTNIIKFIITKIPSYHQVILDYFHDFNEFSQHAWSQICFLRFQCDPSIGNLISFCDLDILNEDIWHFAWIELIRGFCIGIASSFGRLPSLTSNPSQKAFPIGVYLSVFEGFAEDMNARPVMLDRS